MINVTVTLQIALNLVKLGHELAHIRTDVSEECIASIIKMTRIGELRKTLAVTTNRSTVLVTLMMQAVLSSETSILT
jgi:hypothetical protein